MRRRVRREQPAVHDQLPGHRRRRRHGDGTLSIDVDDDTPTASPAQQTGTVDEDGVPGGIAGGIGDVAGEATVATGSVAPLFNSGADQPLTFA